MADQPFINYAKYHKQVQPVLPEQESNEPVATKNHKSSRSGSKPNNQQSSDNKGGAYSGRNYSKEEVIQLIKDYSAHYGIDSETPLCIAKFESGYNQFSKNKSSTASGVFQYLSGTWKGTDEGRAGLSVFDADANVKAAIKYMAIHKNTKPWVVAPKCPSLTFIK